MLRLEHSAILLTCIKQASVLKTNFGLLFEWPVAVEAAFLDLRLSISNDIVSTKFYEKRGDFDFEIVNFPFKMVMFLVLHPMESISLNSFVLLEHLAMLLTSTLAINC